MISGFVASLVLSVIRTTGYVGLFTLSFLENMTVPLPSEVIVPFSGFLASAGRFNLFVVIFVATLGNWLGSVLLFRLVREHGRLIILKYGHYVLLREHDIKRVEGWFKRYGPATVFWLRLVPLGRVLITIPAAIGNMNQRAFSSFTLVGSAIWNILLAWFGYTAGQHWASVQEYFVHFDLFLGVLAVGMMTWWIYFRTRPIRS